MIRPRHLITIVWARFKQRRHRRRFERYRALKARADEMGNLLYWNNPARVQWELNGIVIPQTKQAPEPRPRNDRLAKAIQKFRPR